MILASISVASCSASFLRLRGRDCVSCSGLGGALAAALSRLQGGASSRPFVQGARLRTAAPFPRRESARKGRERLPPVATPLRVEASSEPLAFPSGLCVMSGRMTPSGLPVTSGAEAARRDGSPPRPAPCAPDLGSGPVLGLAGRRPSACGEGLSSDSTLVFSECALQTSVCPSCILSCSLLRSLSQERRPEGGVPLGRHSVGHNAFHFSQRFTDSRRHIGSSMAPTGQVAGLEFLAGH